MRQFLPLLVSENMQIEDLGGFFLKQTQQPFQGRSGFQAVMGDLD
jgi:hypothetical protein